MWTDLSPFPPRLTRRQMLQRMCAGFGLLGLAALPGRALAGGARLAAPQLPHFAPRAKRVVFLFLNGGPSHVDTFDPKPALAQYEGQQPTGKLYKKNKGTGFMPSPFAFAQHGQSGIEVSESLPNLARVIDDCCIIRSMHTDVPNHEPALLRCTRAISSRSALRSARGCSTGSAPRTKICRAMSCCGRATRSWSGPALWSNSFLPAEYQATSVLTSDMAGREADRQYPQSALTRDEQREQLDLLAKLNQRHLAQRDGDLELEGQIRAMETAFQMQREAMKTFDISRESEAVRAQYGDTPFARSCLLARRLLEDGVRCVTVYYTATGTQPWDTHPQSQHAAPEALRRCRPGGRRADRRSQAARDARRHAGRLGRRIRPHAVRADRRQGSVESRPRPSSHRLLHAPRRRRRARRHWPTAPPMNSA